MQVLTFEAKPMIFKDEPALDGRRSILAIVTPERDKQNPRGVYSASDVKRLDVDDVLARSLPECYAETLPSFKERFLFWRRQDRPNTSAVSSEDVLVPNGPPFI